MLFIITAYILVASFFAIEWKFRIGREAQSFRPGEKDRGTSPVLGTSITIMLVTLVTLPWFRLDPLVPAVPYGIFGVVLCAVGIGVRLLANKTLGEFYTRTLLIKSSHQIVDRGIYGVIRHPGYSGQIAMFSGAALATADGVVAGIVAAIALTAYGYRIFVEEKMLVTKFGKDYVDYMERTKRLIPGIF